MSQLLLKRKEKKVENLSTSDTAALSHQILIRSSEPETFTGESEKSAKSTQNDLMTGKIKITWIVEIFGKVKTI